MVVWSMSSMVVRFRIGNCSTYLPATFLLLIYQDRLAAGLVISRLQFILILSPLMYLSLAPMMLGPWAGPTTTSRSPYLVSVAKIGASPLTSHLYLPVEEVDRERRVTWVAVDFPVCNKMVSHSDEN